MTKTIKAAADKVIRTAPLWLVRAVAGVLLPVCIVLALLYRQELVRAERAETEKQLLRERIEELKTTLGAERSAAYWASNKP
jgi:hypothetical protein